MNKQGTHFFGTGIIQCYHMAEYDVRLKRNHQLGMIRRHNRR